MCQRVSTADRHFFYFARHFSCVTHNDQKMTQVIFHTVLPVKGHVCIRIGKRKTRVRSPRMNYVSCLDMPNLEINLTPAKRRLMLMSVRADRARAP